MNEIGQAFLEVALAILSLGMFFFAYALLDKLLRPRLLPASVSPLDERDSTARMVLAFAFYVALPNLTLVGGIACIVVADDLHFIVKDVLIGAVAASLAVTILVFYGAMGARKEASDAEIMERRRQMQADLEQYRTNVFVVNSRELPLPSYDDLDRRSSQASSASTSSARNSNSSSNNNGSSNNSDNKKLELPPSYFEALEIATAGGGDSKKIVSKKRKQNGTKVDIDAQDGDQTGRN